MLTELRVASKIILRGDSIIEMWSCYGNETYAACFINDNASKDFHYGKFEFSTL